MKQSIATTFVISLVCAMVAGAVLGAFGLAIGPIDNEYGFEKAGVSFGKASGQMTFSRMEYATALQPSSTASLSEAISIDRARVTLDSEGCTDGKLFASNVIWLKSYYFEWYIGGQLLKNAVYGDGQPIKNPSNIFSYEGTPENPVIGMVYIARGQVIPKTEDKRTFELATESDIFLLGAYPTGTVLKCVMKANIWAYYNDGPLFTLIDEIKDYPIAEYNVMLKSGEGYVKIGDDLPGVVEEGSNVAFVLKTGYTRNEGWECKIRFANGQTYDFEEDGFTGQDDFYGTVDFKVPIGVFVEGGPNRALIELRSKLYSQSVIEFFYVDSIEKIPGTPAISWQIEEYYSGETVNVQMSAQPNAITNSPIDYFRVYVYYGEPGTMPGLDFPQLYIIQGRDVDATSGQASFSFFIPENKPGQVTIKVNAVDESGRASYEQHKSMEVFNPGQPGGGERDDNVDYGFQLNIGVIVTAIVAVLAVIALFMLAKALPQNLKIFLLIIIVAACTLAIWMFGTHPGWFI